MKKLNAKEMGTHAVLLHISVNQKPKNVNVKRLLIASQVKNVAWVCVKMKLKTAKDVLWEMIQLVHMGKHAVS